MTGRWNSFASLALLFAVVCAPLILSQRGTKYTADERNWHIPATRQIRAHWPSLDLKADSLSATAPGYHYFLATVSLVTGTSRLALRGITWGVSLGLLYFLWQLFPSDRRMWAMAALLPLAMSNFFVKSSVWVVTDNPGMLCATVTLAALFLSEGKAATWRAGIAAGAATFIRQLHVWTAAPTALLAWRTWHRSDRRPIDLALSLPVILPVAVVLLLFLSWHGLVPPAWQSYQVNAGIGTGAIASFCYILAVDFIIGLWFWLAAVDEKLTTALRSAPALLAAAAGLALALVTPTDYNPPDGRWGGYLWNLAAHLPVIGHRSIVFLLLTPLGAALLAAMAARLDRHIGRFEALAWFGSYTVWAATFLPNKFAYQRYFEPMTLVFFILWLLLLVAKTNMIRQKPGWLWTLAVVQLAITLATAHYETWFGPITFPD